MSNFNRNPYGYVEVHTDGACLNNGQAGARAGVGVYFGDNHPMNVSAPVQGRPTNNTAEIQAARRGIEAAAAAGASRVTVHTDSEFVIKGATQWIHNWKNNGWETSTGGPVKNKSEFVKLDQAIRQMDDVQFVHVPGHSNVHGNEQADRLARRGASAYNPRYYE